MNEIKPTLPSTETQERVVLANNVQRAVESMLAKYKDFQPRVTNFKIDRIRPNSTTFLIDITLTVPSNNQEYSRHFFGKVMKKHPDKRKGYVRPQPQIDATFNFIQQYRQIDSFARCYECWDDNENCYYLFEEYTGSKLENSFGRGNGMNFDEVINLISSGGEALSIVHSAGANFGDINAGNFLRDQEGNIRLTDFDDMWFAEVEDEVDPDLKRKRDSFGGFEYIAPESLTLRHDAQVTKDTRSDQYSLALIIYRAIMEGCYPTQNVRERAKYENNPVTMNVYDFIYLRFDKENDFVHLPYQPIAEAVQASGTMPEGLTKELVAIDALLSKALSPNPNDRHSNTLEFTTQLIECLDRMGEKNFDIFRYYLREALDLKDNAPLLPDKIYLARQRRRNQKNRTLTTSEREKIDIQYAASILETLEVASQVQSPSSPDLASDGVETSQPPSLARNVNFKNVVRRLVDKLRNI